MGGVPTALFSSNSRSIFICLLFSVVGRKHFSEGADSSQPSSAPSKTFVKHPSLAYFSNSQVEQCPILNSTGTPFGTVHPEARGDLPGQVAVVPVGITDLTWMRKALFPDV